MLLDLLADFMEWRNKGARRERELLESGVREGAVIEVAIDPRDRNHVRQRCRCIPTEYASRIHSRNRSSTSSTDRKRNACR
jgi:hypothetical protein